MSGSGRVDPPVVANVEVHRAVRLGQLGELVTLLPQSAVPETGTVAVAREPEVMPHLSRRQAVEEAQLIGGVEKALHVLRHKEEGLVVDIRGVASRVKR